MANCKSSGNLFVWCRSISCQALVGSHISGTFQKSTPSWIACLSLSSFPKTMKPSSSRFALLYLIRLGGWQQRYKQLWDRLWHTLHTSWGCLSCSCLSCCCLSCDCLCGGCLGCCCLSVDCLSCSCLSCCCLACKCLSCGCQWYDLSVV